jgi:hypothetical protein
MTNPADVGKSLRGQEAAVARLLDTQGALRK